MTRARPAVPEWADHVGRLCWMLVGGLAIAAGVLLASQPPVVPGLQPVPVVSAGER